MPVPKGDGPGPRVLTLPADLRPLDRGAASRPGFVQARKVEQAFGEALFEGREGFGGRHGGRMTDQGPTKDRPRTDQGRRPIKRV